MNVNMHEQIKNRGHMRLCSKLSEDFDFDEIKVYVVHFFSGSAHITTAFKNL